MNVEWPIEALKAQAVAARSYALYKIKKRIELKKWGKFLDYDIESSERHQMSGHFFESTKKTSSAVKMTEGEVLLGEKNKFYPIFFHASCGGRTLSPHQVWEENISSYKSTKCPYCHYTKKRNWEQSFSSQEFFKVLAFSNESQKEFSKVKILSNSPENAYWRAYIGHKLVTLKKSLFRRVFGRRRIPSNYFSIKVDKEKIILKGNGLGHGVGLCQIGALKMAQNGKNYKEILEHYFPKFKLKKINLQKFSL